METTAVRLSFSNIMLECLQPGSHGDITYMNHCIVTAYMYMYMYKVWDSRSCVSLRIGQETTAKWSVVIIERHCFYEWADLLVTRH